MTKLIIITMLSFSLAHYVPSPVAPNVGTVLFAPSDLSKRDWSRTNIALLQARKYMQNILPSPHLGSINEEYISNLLNYVEKSYKTVKRETKNPYLCNMMDVALSDTLGGYLKIWVLPIAKYSYYGGVLPLESCIKVFDTYEEIKRSLKTDGQGWRCPNKNLLNYVEISVAPPLYPPIRSMSSPCEQLAYYVKTDEGMKVPMPFINWELSPPTMFLPLLNESIISLSSPRSSSALQKYYAIADECMKSDIHNLDDFHNRFEMWLSHEVAPHLNDDKFYAAFGSILSLMHSTKQFCGEQIGNLKERLLRDPVTFTSKRFLIIALILVVELLWCIPTVVYTVRIIKKKRIKKNGNRTYPSEENCIESLGKGNSDTKTSLKQSKHGLKLHIEPKTANLEIGTQSSYQCSKNLKPLNLFSVDVLSHCSLINLENELPSKVPSVVKRPNLDTASILIKNRNTKSETTSRPIQIVDKTDVEKTQELKLSRTFTLVQSTEKYKKKLTHGIEIMKSSHKSTLDGKFNNIIPNTYQEYSNEACIKSSQNRKRDIVNKPKTKRQKLKIEETDKKSSSKTVMFSQTEPIIEKEKGTMVKQNDIGVNNKEGRKLRSADKPMLSILIEKPQTLIELGITSSIKPSKIPRAVRLNKNPDSIKTETSEPLTKRNNLKIKTENTQSGKRVIRGKTLDDSTIKDTSNNKKDKKLNETL